MKIINTTRHTINVLKCHKLSSGECKGKKCWSCNEGIVKRIEPKITISATPKEKEEKAKGKGKNGVNLVSFEYKPSLESMAKLDWLEDYYPDHIIVGSIISAQAFPGRVYGMVPVPGFERVPPERKLVRDDKFSIFEE